MTVKIGVVGTSWWADAMYLPALRTHPDATLAALCGRDSDKARHVAAAYDIPKVYTDAERMFREGGLDAVVIATANETHHPLTLAALRAGLHVLCEKPLALTYAQAREMADLARAGGRITMVPFTYSYMPVNRAIKQKLDEGYLGKPFHLNLRYYAGYGFNTAYMWRFDARTAGSGAIGDIGSHFLYLARWWFGEIESVCALAAPMLDRAPLDPSGQPYPHTEDCSIMLLRFASGAQGVVQASTIAWAGTPFGQTHHAELNGSNGTLQAYTDWDTVQQLSGAQVNAGPVRPLEIPETIWGGVRRDTVHNTYRDVFRTQNHMARQFASAIARGADPASLRPNFEDGCAIQRLTDAAVRSAAERRWVDVAEIG